ncbi:MAG: tRNA preQ1(34) S-adenosylmethionine ribosyltransferase-isomerase QueA [Candidatus Dactylopiibacterium carminicum]|uniref:S-adenosylmethionine:tRNA ribosyltransferase-isomerase n=1 Tax=Candidatus Dactylopiibacterium carminicum TaxID=857335 RepID=A0A272EQA5_9RHOO|nr:tRNA preQ1(34) S-adenosylmethionine ribosyltransferase-isomerase QueA [Candidatus Dactylopiibacterium carminicum]KAF7598573.1 tRNA preQ1(34) S-adenosylmethionine ribosyltransferase-isomerase QueA [Candidatus Dactylopiibacterium carminicum]PAS92293.1 MAG: tRNA preQ1(34) S-adenosylmethionine ribosyltransferase-isomerase QueA [Candidatus Dactylopiibacterium carminicum]PAS93983.1 MAG: tRNA preQ1(34) S-adenosylmethionine ribosyltransferase-isomerase QueA [Candidatus Dactylopiibacterium carminicum]
MLSLDDFDYPLPPELIAQHALADRAASRLLLAKPDALEDRAFRDLPQLLRANDLLVFNDSRVLHARLFGQKETGGQVEVMVERPIGDHEVLAMVRASKSPKPGTRLRLMEAFDAEVVGRAGANDEFFQLRFPSDAMAVDYIERHGRLPLPPYIEHAATESDESRYQTVYARELGSVAAPTAGLHFDESLFAELAAMGVRRAFVTLHVGAGTFQPVREQDLSRHKMHRELYSIPQDTVDAVAATRAAGGRVICVGTTSLRAVESAAQAGTLRAGSSETGIFITPGYDFRVADGLITNFHLPKSTLLMLVSALAGMDTIRRAYAHAVEQRYRFFSYGDAMLLERN